MTTNGNTHGADERGCPRSGPIVWGVLILAFCAWVAQRAFSPETIDPQIWLIGLAIGLGMLLLGVGALIAVRERKEPRSDAVL